MNKKQFKIWLAMNDYSQKSLAQKLNLTEPTISNYCTKNRFPTVFAYALKGLEHEKSS